MKSLLSRTSSGIRVVPIAVVPMTYELVEKWHTYVQPFIDANYKHWFKGADPQIVRADRLWNWHDNFTLLSLHNTACALKSKPHEEALAMCIVFRSEDGVDEFPIGMLTALPKFYTNVDAHKRHRAFTWYLSDAPSEVFSDILGIPPIQGIAKALLDCTIQAALDEGEDGNLLLKADPHGGEKLINFYKLCGMTQLGKHHPPITPYFRRFQTHNYFNFLGPDAQAYSSQYNLRR